VSQLYVLIFYLMLKIIDGKLVLPIIILIKVTKLFILIAGNGRVLQQQHQLHFTFICIHFITLCLKQSKLSRIYKQIIT